MKRLMLMTMVAVVLITGSALSVSADSYRRYSERQIREVGFSNGYELGWREGLSDRRSGFGFDYKRNRVYRNGMVGYRDEYYHDGNYKNGFRRGFEEGYRDAFSGRRRAYYNNRPGWNNGGYYDRDSCDVRDYRRQRY